METNYGPRGPHTELEAYLGQVAERRRVRRIVRVRGDWGPARRH
jgi:hypothetical protein